MTKITIPKGDKTREAIEALSGYVYQIYQSALALIELEPEEILFLEVAEDYAKTAADALEAVQIKETTQNVTINSSGIVASIDSFVQLRKKNPSLQIRLRHLTTSKIGKEKCIEHRLGDTPTLELWRMLSKTGNLTPLRNILSSSKISTETKKYIENLTNKEFRDEFLKRIHFDCGALESKFLVRQLRSKLSKLLIERGGVTSQVVTCLNNILMTLLSKATQKEDRFVDRNTLEELLEKATQVTVNREQLEIQRRLVNKALGALPEQSTNLIATRIGEPRSINEVPLPSAIANRNTQINNIVTSLSKWGISWIYGAAGVGKTIGAKIAAQRIKGNWVSINLRGLKVDQTYSVLSGVIDTIKEREINGILIDDIECPLEPNIIDILLYIMAICNRTDLLLIIISPKPASSDFLFLANLTNAISQKFEEFSKQDLKAILDILGIHDTNWVKYIHLVSGGGHPQLAIAAIQSMQNKGWDKNELKTLNSLLQGNMEIEQVRSRTRQRLLNEMPANDRRLLERLSLKLGSFPRSFVLDIAQIEPSIPNSGIILDKLIGSWIDQQEYDLFALSPLLSNFAVSTLTDTQKKKINFEIANLLIKRHKLNPIEANSALFAAWVGKNELVITHLCMGIFISDQNDVKMIAPYLMMFTFMKTDDFAYEDNPVINQMFRGVQLLLCCQKNSKREKIEKLIACFEKESSQVKDKRVRNAMSCLVYLKLLICENKIGSLPKFWNLINKIKWFIENQEEPFINNSVDQEINGISILGFIFINQVQQIKFINELLPVFEFLNSCDQKFREKLTKPYKDANFDFDFLVSGAWLKQNDAKTIDPPKHSKIFVRLEEYAKKWNYIELAVSCRKFHSIIIDENEGDKDKALLILNEGLKIYGETNSELVRAKARVLYRAKEHQESLELSKMLIEGNSQLSETEKAFLGRDAAISAEKQGDYKTARSYFIYGSTAAGKCGISNMIPMKVGLLADAALSSWHVGDRETCLKDLITVLQELNNINPKSSLRAAHCHAVSRHLLLWLDQDATGIKTPLPNGKETQIFPGIVSNPEPHPEIKDRYISPIDIAWYMLAQIENNCLLDLGITKNLESLLPNGPVFEGQLLLSSSKIKNATILHENEFFVTALEEIISVFCYNDTQSEHNKSFDIKNVTYGTLPIPTREQQTKFIYQTEHFILCYIANLIFTNKVTELDALISNIEKNQKFSVQKTFLNAFRGSSSYTDFNTYFAYFLFIHTNAINQKGIISPAQVFDLILMSLQVAGTTNHIDVIVNSALKWINEKWLFILKYQRFSLRNINFYEKK